MKYIAILLLLFSLLKSIYYAFFEINEKENKSGGITIIILSLLGFIFPTLLLLLIY